MGSEKAMVSIGRRNSITGPKRYHSSEVSP
jgi:hypothetical protein